MERKSAFVRVQEPAEDGKLIPMSSSWNQLGGKCFKRERDHWIEKNDKIKGELDKRLNRCL